MIPLVPLAEGAISLLPTQTIHSIGRCGRKKLCSLFCVLLRVLQRRMAPIETARCVDTLID